MNYLDPRTLRTILAFERALPATQSQIVAASGLSRCTVVRLVKRFHGTSIYIARWVKHPVHGPSIPVYALGNRKDAIDNLPRMTRLEISRRYEKRIKGTEKDDQRTAVKRARHWVKKAATTPQTWLSALSGGDQ